MAERFNNIQGNIDTFYALIGENPNILEDSTDNDKPILINNPLHMAASEGHTHLALEIIRLKPSFAKKLNQDGYTPMHLAMQNGHINTVLRLLKFDRELVRVGGREGLTPLHYAAKEGLDQLLQVFIAACPESLEDVTIYNETAWHVALKHDKLDSVKLMLNWCQNVCRRADQAYLNHKDENGNTPLDIAVAKRQVHVVKLLKKAMVNNNAINKAGLAALDISNQANELGDIDEEIRIILDHEEGALEDANYLPNYMRMDERLKAAAKVGNTNVLYSLLAEEPYLLERVDKVPFIDTPLHIATSHGQVHFALEILKWKPSFGRKPNQQGFYPIHLALKNGHTCKILQKLLAFDKDLVELAGREAKTPLHLAAEEGALPLLHVLLSACPKSIQAVTIRKESALHIALKHGNLDAFWFLLRELRIACHEGSSKQEKHIVNLKDEEGNTVLHIATRNNHSEIVGALIKCKVDLNGKNSLDKTALDVAEELQLQDVRKMLHKAGALKASSLKNNDEQNIATCEDDQTQWKISFVERFIIYMIRLKRDMPAKEKNLLLVVSVLIATVTYQAAVSPPKDDDHDIDNIPSFLKIANTNHNSSILSLILINITDNGTLNNLYFKGNKNSISDLHHATSRGAIFFWTSNILALWGSLMTIFFVLPSKYILPLLIPPLYFFVYMYMVSMAISAGSRFWLKITCGLLIISYWAVVYVYIASKRVERKQLGGYWKRILRLCRYILPTRN